MACASGSQVSTTTARATPGNQTLVDDSRAYALRTQSKLSSSHALELFNFGEPEFLSAQFRYYTNQQALASDLEDENCAASLE